MPHSQSLNHRFIVIEGVDGVGKTTIARTLAFQLGAVYVRTPTSTLESFVQHTSDGAKMKLRHYVDQLARTSPRTRFLFYLFCVSEASHHIEGLLETTDVVCDRYLASTLAYHRVLEPELASVDVEWIDCLQPDFQFLLEVNNTREHVDRLAGRLPRSDKALEENMAFLDAVKREFRQLGLQVVDTTGRSIEGIVREIVHYIELAREQLPTTLSSGGHYE